MQVTSRTLACKIEGIKEQAASHEGFTEEDRELRSKL